MPRHKPLKPIFPLYFDEFYLISFILSCLFNYFEYPILHGLFSIIPLFTLLYIVKRRLINRDLGSVLVTLGLFAESFCKLFIPFTYSSTSISLIFTWWKTLQYIFLGALLLFMLYSTSKHFLFLIKEIPEIWKIT